MVIQLGRNRPSHSIVILQALPNFPVSRRKSHETVPAFPGKRRELRAIDEPTHKRYKRMEAAWRALAEEQDWLDGEISPTRTNGGELKTPPSQTNPQIA
jgi:hypothetical protein